MNSDGCFISILLILTCKIYIVTSSECIQITETSGTITNEKRASRYSKCWRFSVPQHSRAFVNMESFITNEHCEDTEVKVSLVHINEEYVFCPKGHWEPLVLDDDFSVTHSIFSYGNPFTSKISLKYKIESLLCSQEDAYKCSDGMCLLQSQVCDGTENCFDGADEKECRNMMISVPELDESRISGIQWLKKKLFSTSVWQENTHRGITALFLASDINVKNLNTEEKLMIKQLEVQILLYLLRKETHGMTASHLSMFVNALTASCRHPRNFYGHNLVKLLKDEVEHSSIITRPAAYLALCNAGETLPVNATHHLRSMLKAHDEYAFLLEIQAVAVMALSCLQSNIPKNLTDAFPQIDYEETVKKFKELQLEDGSFGNIHTTAVVTQALLSVDQRNSETWQYKKSISHLIQYLNSSSVDFLAVYLILPILNGKSLSHIRNINCSIINQRNLVSDVKTNLGPKMRVQYSLYIGDEKDIVYTISLRVPENITVFEVMQLAESADSKYKFRSKQMGEKLYTYEIASIINDFEECKFWLLYVGNDTETLRLIHESPNKITLQDGAHLVMWYKKAQI